MNYNLFAVILLSFVLSAIMGKFLIPILKEKHIGQNIREVGPKSHMGKAGTPTMGGVIIILTFFVISFIVIPKGIKLATLLISSIGFGAIGFFDDFRKLVLKQSEGLNPKQKIVLQVLLSFFICTLNYYFNPEIINVFTVPILNFKIHTGLLGIPIMMFIIIGTVNAANLTDGLDGLISTVSLPIFLVFILISSSVENIYFSSIMFGALLGFLIYNSNPASVFMGDTGSMAIGGAVVSLAINSGIVIHLIILAGVFMFEALSVILQVWSYRHRNKKRIFLMSPIHHHFELKGYKESKIVTVFGIVSCILSLITLMIL
ncbi:MAG: phospho-N-acetylmuramoyl-pentapeptide-transferase [Peptoniphilaceae bacterium]|nr:phospho-N-acetylmuramoyl-pentapeptide-transferase [Peptoniphilaceae bacterium]MDD7383583.1 phospho-N-acetylmuramoyl-pentapeptide-transferase [Peptoniphilaceae bacterium]MDY3738755.1 phospho-N-acetylmuramoyl-pentapeptide-transferase [Peptoniphilaceae bacterium]